MARSNQSNSIALSEINDQFFTEVSPEQAAVVEGGLRVQLLQLRCLEAGGGSDQVFAEFNGVRSGFGRTQFMRRNFVANFTEAGGSGSSVRVRLRDASNGNASLGSFRVSSTVKNSRTQVISGNGSRYEVTFNAPF
ncbi:MAG: hypothetical protein HY785_10435 [Oscillatoriophycideae cyanobacterium NC_groundwater_1537_Pr4_S-0.65um_50_18]|nr:hypothetical protein [Oscillatoriophycideae cyanobacterium NC_groundwater_1537_Pr4_S-0.65um_50_18]